MAQPDYFNEAGLQDATFPDFIGPALVGGAALKTLYPAALVAQQAITAGLASPEAGKVFDSLSNESGAINLGLASEESGLTATKAAQLINSYEDKCVDIGDYARAMQFKALRAALEQSQMSPADIAYEAQKIWFK